MATRRVPNPKPLTTAQARAWVGAKTRSRSLRRYLTETEREALQTVQDSNAVITSGEAAAKLGPQWEALVEALEAAGYVSWRYGKLVIRSKGRAALASR